MEQVSTVDAENLGDTPCRYCIAQAVAGIGEAQAELALGARIAVSELGQHGLKVANGEAEPFGMRKLHGK
jgi:hypothetical protein